MLKPIADYILIQPIKHTKIGKIYLPNQSSGLAIDLAKVLAVGPGKLSNKGHLMPPQVKIGDYIIYNTCTEVLYRPDSNKTGYALVQEYQIIATIDKEDIDNINNIG